MNTISKMVSDEYMIYRLRLDTLRNEARGKAYKDPQNIKRAQEVAEAYALDVYKRSPSYCASDNRQHAYNYEFERELSRLASEADDNFTTEYKRINPEPPM